MKKDHKIKAILFLIIMVLYALVLYSNISPQPYGVSEYATNPAEILNLNDSGYVKLPAYSGDGNSMLCIDQEGTVYRGNSSSC